jgi:hypothetical protein
MIGHQRSIDEQWRTDFAIEDPQWVAGKAGEAVVAQGTTFGL